MESKDHIKNILKDFYRHGTGSAAEAIIFYAPDADKSFVEAALKRFKAGGFTVELLNACAESIQEYKPAEKSEKKSRYQSIAEES